MSVMSSLVFGAHATAALQVIVCPLVALNESINEEEARDQTDTWDEGRGVDQTSSKILPATREPIKLAFPRSILVGRLSLPLFQIQKGFERIIDIKENVDNRGKTNVNN